MPELPEVEVAARNLRRWGAGHRIERTWVDARAGRVFRPGSLAAVRRLTGARIGSVRRTGKNLLVTATRSTGAASATASAASSSASAGSSKPRLGLWSHLGMTGKWVRRRAGDRRPPHARLDLTLDDGSRLIYVDPRMFGRFRLVPDARFDEVPELRALGPDPLTDGIDVHELATRLAGLPRGRAIKVALLDQSLLAGIGNIQACEALFRARIDPRRPAASLGRAEVSRLRRGIVASIAFTLAALVSGGARGHGDIEYVEDAGAENPFLVYDRAGQTCPRRKGSRIDRIVQAGRATFFCPDCQGS